MIIPQTVGEWSLFTIFTLFVFAITIIFHELGHYLAMAALKLKPYFRIEKGLNIGVASDYLFKITKTERALIALLGILAGLLPLLILSEAGFFIIYLALYIAGSSKDISIFIQNIGG